MIIFLLLVGMLFTYYFLARVEERRMLAIDSSYADYLHHTGMFLPGNPGDRLYRLLFGNLRDQKLARRLALTSSLVLVLLLGFGLRAYTVRHIARTAVLPNVEVVSVYPMAATTMQQLFSLAVSDPSVQQALQREGNATFVAHLLPHDYGMIGKFADVGTGHMVPGNIRLSRFKYLCGWLLPFLDSHMRTDLMGTKRGLASASFWKRSTTKNACTRLSAIVRPPSSNGYSRRPCWLGAHFPEVLPSGPVDCRQIIWLGCAVGKPIPARLSWQPDRDFPNYAASIACLESATAAQRRKRAASQH